MYKTTEFSTWTQYDHFGKGQCVDGIGLAAVRGMESARNQRGSNTTKRKPPPLIFHGSPRLSSRPRKRTNSSNALQEAALKSATSLISAMSDVFRPAHLSAHPSAHPKSSKHDLLDSATRYCRPRAYTAPPTPLAESVAMNLVELPGSMPGDGDNLISPARFRTCGQHLLPNYVNQKIERPHSSPQERTNMTPSKRERVSIESFYRDASPSKAFQLPPWFDDGGATPRIDVTLPRYDQVDAAPYSSNKGPTNSLKRPALSVLPVALPESGLTTPLLTSLPGSMNAVPQLETSSRTGDHPQEGAHAFLLEQISNMRSSHDAHLKTLKAAHEKEIACHESYISFLERRQGIESNYSKQNGTFAAMRPELQDNAKPRKQSQDSSIDLGSTLVGNDTSVTNEPVLYHKEYVAVGEVRKERDELRDAADVSERKISQLKAILRKTKAQDKALKNAILNLEGRLEEANTERIDVLEGFHEATRKLQSLALREKILKQEVEDLRSSKDSAGSLTASLAIERTSENQSVSRNRHYRTYSDVGGVSIRSSKLSQQVYDLQRTVEEKDARIRHLEEVAAEARASKADNPASTQTLNSDRTRDLENEVETYKRLYTVAQADSERYNSLLHNEMRRQIRNTIEKCQPPIPQVEVEALSLASSKVEQLKAECENHSSNPNATKTDDLPSSTLVSSLERELEHCIKEIILYKWDVKGYKKDLRKAHAKIQNLEGRSFQHSVTPDTQPSSNAGSYTSVSSHRRYDSKTTEQLLNCGSPGQFGLGVSILETPKAVENIAQVITPPPRSSNLSSPAGCVPRTPLGIHKKLPKPPSSTSPGLSPPAILRQSETRRSAARSLSENVIASHTQRLPHDLEDSGRAPLSDPNTPRLHVSGSPALPLSKFTSMSFVDRPKHSVFI